MSSWQGGEGGKPKDNLVNRPYLIEKTTRGGGGGQKSPILRRHSLWTAPMGIVNQKNLLPTLIYQFEHFGTP